MRSLSIQAGSPASASRLLLAIGAMTSVEFLETGMVMFLASQIMAGLELSPEAFAFTFTLYGVTSIFMLYKHQWMVERLGYRDFVLTSLLVFACGTILCATATGLAQFAVGRAMQGLGGATFFTAGRMQVKRLPEAKQFYGLLIFIGSLLGASALAPLSVVGLFSAWGWRAVFWGVLPWIAGVAWIVAPCLARELTPLDERSETHWGWLLWMALGVFGLQYAIQELPLQAPAHTGQLALVGMASILVLSIFAWRQWRHERPLINYRELCQWRYLSGLGFYFSGYLMAGASGFVLPIFFQQVLGWSLASTAGIVTLGLCCSILLALVHTALARRWPQPRPYMFCALLFYAAGNLLLSQLDSRAEWSDVLLPIFLCGTAMSFFLGPVAVATFSELAPQAFSHGYQVKNIVRQLGLSSGIALVTLALQCWHVAPIDALAKPSANPLTIASSNVFLALALFGVPLLVTLLLQRVFR